MFFNVINQDSTRIDGRLVPHRFHDQSGSLLFVFEVWGVHENESLVLGCDLEVFFQDAQLVFGVLVEPNFSDPQNVVFGQEFGDHLHHFSGKANIFSFFWIDTQPSEMVDAVGAGSGGFNGGELVEVIAKALG